MAVQQTANSRFLLAVPMFIPSLMMYAIERRRLAPKNFYLNIILQTLLFTFELYFEVPFAIGMYP